MFSSMLADHLRATQDSYTIELANDDSDVIEAMLYFCYHSTIFSKFGKNKKTYTADFRVRVYCIASKYKFPALQDTSAADLKKNPIVFMFKSPQEVISVIRSINNISTCDTDRLWDTAVPGLVSNISRLAKNDEFFALLLEMPTLN
ncbi:hypothetical protein LTS10_005869 [Elasticomyces elasticus]|nr:hypothetical protein LTS10_005869 [Elasticomyces elasticus]